MRILDLARVHTVPANDNTVPAAVTGGARSALQSCQASARAKRLARRSHWAGASFSVNFPGA